MLEYQRAQYKNHCFKYLKSTIFVVSAIHAKVFRTIKPNLMKWFVLNYLITYKGSPISEMSVKVWHALFMYGGGKTLYTHRDLFCLICYMYVCLCSRKKSFHMVLQMVYKSNNVAVGYDVITSYIHTRNNLSYWTFNKIESWFLRANNEVVTRVFIS